MAQLNQHQALSLEAQNAFWGAKTSETPGISSRNSNAHLRSGLPAEYMESFQSAADLQPTDKVPIADEGALQLNYNDYVFDKVRYPDNNFESPDDFNLTAGYYATGKYVENVPTDTDYDSNYAQFLCADNVAELLRLICNLYRREGIQIDTRILKQKLPKVMLKFAQARKSNEKTRLQDLWAPSDNQQLIRDYMNDLYISTIVIPNDARLTDDAMVQRRQRVITKDSEGPSEVKTFKNMIASDIQNLDVWDPLRSYIKQDFRGDQIHQRPQREFFKHVRLGVADAHGTLWQDDVGGSKETPLRKWDMTAFKQGPYAERFNNNYHYNFNQDMFK